MFSYPTPFTPPTTEDDRLSWLRLIRSHRVGVASFHRLMAEHGSARAALLALPEIARAAGVERYAPCPEAVAHAEVKAGKAAGARMICYGEAEYPRILAEIPDAPPVLWCLGDTAQIARPMVALVGARNASSLGTRTARKLAAGLGEAGITIVSGLARGIDTAAHKAALDTGTVAVMAGGIDTIYPAENTELADMIAKSGLRLSEQPVGLAPLARHFPLRNRIISGLCRAVVVVEAAARSGSLITARAALDQGRDVLAVPGHPFDGRAAGCNMLIRDGAQLVRGVDDVLEALAAAGICADPAPKPGLNNETAVPRPDRNRHDHPMSHGHAAQKDAARHGPSGQDDRKRCDQSDLHSKILDRLGPSPLAEDQLIRDLSLPAAAISSELVALELDGQITRQPGGLLTRVA